MERLLAWAVSEGAVIRKLLPQSRRFVVGEDVQAGDTLISVPQHLLLHTQLAYNDAEYAGAFRQLAAELGPQLDDRHLLCMLLVLEKARQQDSAWEPYISILPEEYDDPYWWSEEQIQLVKGTRLARAIHMHYPGLEHIAASLKRLEQLYSSTRLPGSPVSVLRTFRGGWALQLAAARWARSAVWSRSFTIRMMSTGARNVVAMVPVLDMIDHSPAMEVVWHTGRDGSEPFQFVPLTAVSQGTVMHNNYGRKSSDELLLAYGFLLDGPNPADHLIVSLAHSRAPPTAGHRPSSCGSWGTQLAAGSAAVGMLGQSGIGSRVSSAEDGGDEDQAQQQQAAEDLQRALAMTSLKLAVEQKLGEVDPLPAQLLLGAQLCLLPPSQLYLWTAHIQSLQEARLASSAQGSGSPKSHSPGRHAQARTGVLGGEDVLMPGQTPSHARAMQGLELAAPRAQQEPLAGHKRSWHVVDEVQDAVAGNLAVPHQQQGHGQPYTGRTDAAPQNPELSCLLEAASAMHIGPLASVSSGSATAALTMHKHLPVHLVHQLQALVSTREQLQSRLDSMAGEQQVQAAAQRAQAGTPEGGVARTARHSQLAVSYVTVQRALVNRSLAAAAQQVCAQVQGAADVLNAAHQQQLIRWAALGGRPSSFFPHELVGGSHQLPLGAWGSIDPDTHLAHYLGWLRLHGLVPSTQTADTEISIGNEGAAGAAASSRAVCLLQEVVHTRGAPPRFLARRSSSREVVVKPQEAAPAVGVPAEAKPATARVRGPPSSSRTFTMKGQQGQNPSSQAGPAGKHATLTTQNEGRTTTTGPNTITNTAKRVSLPQGLGASLGIDSDHDPVAQGVQLVSAVEAGDTMLAAPLECCLWAATKQQLICALMSTAHQLLLSLLVAIRPHLTSQPGPNGQGTASPAGMASTLVPLTQPHHMLVWHLLHTVAAPAAGRLSMSDVEGVQLLAEMLEDSPSGGAYQEAFDSLKAEYMQLRKSAGSSASQRPAAGPQSPGMPKGATLSRLLSQPSSCHLYCWAAQVAERCALEVPNPWAPSTPQASAEQHTASAASPPPSNSTARAAQKAQSQAGTPRADGGSGGAGGGATCWVLAPVVCCVPRELRQAVLTPDIQLVSTPATPCGSTGPGPSSTDGDTVMADASNDAAAAPSGANTSRKQLAPGNSEASGTSAVLRVRAACSLPAGLHLSPLLLLPDMDMEELMAAWGPEALPWQQLLHRCIPGRATSTAGAARTWEPLSRSTSLLDNNSKAAPAGLAARQSTDGSIAVVVGDAAGSSQAGLCPAVSLRTSSITSSCGAAALAQGSQHSRTVLYELYVCPGERDPLCHMKLLLLAATGLGCVHYLTDDLVTKRLVMCALKICLADQQLLQHPIALKCIQLHAALRAEQGTDSGPDLLQPTTPHHSAPFQPLQQQRGGSAVTAGSPKLGAAPMQGEAWGVQAPRGHAGMSPGTGAGALVAASSAGGGGTASHGAAQEELHELQAHLLAMLAGLPEDHPVCKASRKQLRQMVHDARKNTRRRLKQLEAVHNVVATHTSSSARGATYSVVGALGGSFHPLGGSCALHEGVRLYLQAVCDVLDTWADHLGLNRQSDSMSKRHKGRSDE